MISTDASGQGPTLYGDQEFGPQGFDVFAGGENLLLANLRAGGPGLHHRRHQRQLGEVPAAP